MTCLYSWGLIITYEIIMNSLVGRVIYVFFQNKDTYPSFSNYEEEEWNTLKIRAIVLGSINLILIILCLVKDIGRMKIFNIFWNSCFILYYYSSCSRISFVLEALFK